MQPQIVYKTVDESITYTIDISDLTTVPVTTIIGTEVQDFHTEEPTTDIQITDIIIDESGFGINFRLSGGVANNLYIVQIKFGLSNGDILEGTFYVFVEDFL